MQRLYEPRQRGLLHAAAPNFGRSGPSPVVLRVTADLSSEGGIHKAASSRHLREGAACKAASTRPVTARPAGLSTPLIAVPGPKPGIAARSLGPGLLAAYGHLGPASVQGSFADFAVREFRTRAGSVGSLGACDGLPLGLYRPARRVSGLARAGVRARRVCGCGACAGWRRVRVGAVSRQGGPVSWTDGQTGGGVQAGIEGGVLQGCVLGRRALVVK
jgi:hypothetical protein